MTLENISNYNKKRDKKVLIIFDDMIADHAFTEYSNDMNDILENINNYKKKRDKKSINNF